MNRNTMTIVEILSDKNITGKAKTTRISQMLLDSEIDLAELITVAESAKDSSKATCIEAMEHTTRTNPELITTEGLQFVTRSLLYKAPRVKMEAARVIGNTAKIFQTELETAIANLLQNADDIGTVVRWSSAFALREIVKSQNPLADKIIPDMEAIRNREEQKSIVKIYDEALRVFDANSKKK